MGNYGKTVPKEYREKKLLLMNKERDKLFQIGDGFCIEIEFSEDGDLSVSKISTRSLREKRLDNSSLRKIGKDFLWPNDPYKDPSVPQVLRYFVTPLMEIERIFNCLRYQYLKAIKKSGFDEPQELIHWRCNKAFQALAGMSVYQGRTKRRKSNDCFWKEQGFKSNSKFSEEANTELNALGFITRYIRKSYCNMGRHHEKKQQELYKELIAIKPGFHEVFMDIAHPETDHPTHKETASQEENKKRDSQTFAGTSS